MNIRIKRLDDGSTSLGIPKRIKGAPVCAGAAVGVPTFIVEEKIHFPLKDEVIHRNFPAGEYFMRIVKRTKDELEFLQIAMEERLSEVGSQIFRAHIFMLEDESFSGVMLEKINQGLKIEEAIAEVVDFFIRSFNGNGNSLVREKIHDVKDLGRRLLINLKKGENRSSDFRGNIIFTPEVLPSDLVSMALGGAEGFVLYGTNAAAHVAILARSLDVPVLITNSQSYFDMVEAKQVLLDAYRGEIIVDPSKEIIEEHQTYFSGNRKTRNNHGKNGEAFLKNASGKNNKTYTTDGTRIRIYANINLLSDLTTAKEGGAEGIGLYRSEMPFIIRNNYLNEEEQYSVYTKIFSGFGKEKEIFFRTLDIGGDKQMTSLYEEAGDRKALGLRAIRFCLRHKEIFAEQLRAVLRAGYGKKLSVMFPLISSMDDFLEAKNFLYKCIVDLTEEGYHPNPEPRIGAMVELPSAVDIAGELADEASFLSIGTNDLVQYLLGIDRTNEYVSHYYTMYHPSVLRSVEKVIREANEKECDVSVCGDAAMDFPMLRFMLGAGLRKISVDPKRIGEVRLYVEETNLEEVRRLAKNALKAPTIAEVKRLLGAA